MALPQSSLFDFELDGETLIVTPPHDLGEFSMTHFDEESPQLHQFWSTSAATSVVVDFRRTDYYGFTAIGLLIKLRQLVKHRNGNLVLCGLSPHESEILAITGLDHLCPVCSTREQALELVRTPAVQKPR